MKKSIKFIYVALIIISGGLSLFIINNMKKSTINSVKFNNEFCDSIVNKTITKITPSMEYTVPVSCNISIGKEVSYIFSFENISEDKKPDFILNLYNSSDNTFVQGIKLAYSWKFDTYTINLHDDINGDGYKDMLLRVFGPRASQFTYFIYNPTKNVFEEDNVLSKIFTPTFNKETMEINTTADVPDYYTDGNGEQQYSTPEEDTEVFKFKNGKYTN